MRKAWRLGWIIAGNRLRYWWEWRLPQWVAGQLPPAVAMHAFWRVAQASPWTAEGVFRDAAQRFDARRPRPSFRLWLAEEDDDLQL